MDAHNVARGRGSVARALAAYRGSLVGVGIPGDLLYPPDEVLRWTRAAGVPYRELASPSGHDAFLLETESVGSILAEALHTGAPPPARLQPARVQPSAVAVLE